MNVSYLTLIDYVPLRVALAAPPGGGSWEVVTFKRREGTGYATCEVTVSHAGSTDVLAFHGALVSSLGDGQLEEEAERMRRVVEAASQALRAIEGHLAFRKAL